MNWDRIAGEWQQFKGHAKSRWAKLSDDDVDNVAGKRDVLIGKIQVRYGVLKEAAEKQVDGWVEKVSAKLLRKPAPMTVEKGQPS